MIAGMVAKLAGELQANPNDPQGWAMLIRSLTVQGDKIAAAEALGKALTVFKDDQPNTSTLMNLGKELGLPDPLGSK